jgi:hypothetical protein
MELQDIASQINFHHEQAFKKANDALEHAKEAGLLLLKIKDSLPHGQFTPWINAHCRVSERQSQRYMAVAKGKPIPIRRLAGKTDTHVSLLKPIPKTSTGTWVDDRWIPERGFMYLFKEGGANYWVHPAANGGVHVCKHYSGKKMSSAGFYWRYTILAVNTDEELTSQFYVGTRHAPHNIRCVHDILVSYGLKDFKGSFVFGSEDNNPSEQPWGEPEPENWYWDSETPDDDLYGFAKKSGLLNHNGVPVRL